MLFYIGLGFLSITLFFVFINAIKGLIRGLKKTIVSLIAVVASAIVAAILTTIICLPEMGIVSDLSEELMSLMATGPMAELLAIREVNDLLSRYLFMIVAPFIFVALYTVLSLIIGIVAGIVAKRVKIGNNAPKVANKLGGLGVGIVCGILVSALILVPVVGIIDIVVSASQVNVGASESHTVDAGDNDLYNAYLVTSGRMFDAFASSEYDGQRVYLREDMKVVLSMATNAGALTGNAAQFGDDQIRALHAIIDETDKSPIWKGAVSGVTSDMSGKWMSGETFMGQEKINAGDLLTPTLDSVLEVMSTSDSTTIIADLNTYADMMEVLVSHGMLAHGDNYELMLTKLSQEGIITKLVAVAETNPRMDAFANEISNLSVRALALSIRVPDVDEEQYDFLMENIAGALNESGDMSDSERQDYVENHIEDLLDDYGVEVGGEASRDIAASLINNLGDEDNLEAEDIDDFFADYSKASK